MDKVQSKEELLAWLERTQKLHAQLCDGRETPLPPLKYAVEYKLDGLTINLTYRGGQLVEAATRGNGEVGEAILPPGPHHSLRASLHSLSGTFGGPGRVHHAPEHPGSL